MARPFAALLALALVGVTVPSAGQSADLEHLRSAVLAAPDDASARCSLAFGLVRAGDGASAVIEATTAISALVPRTDASSRRLLGVCLYNRGRARELLGARSDAMGDYFSSLAVRPNTTVEARLRSLVPAAPAEVPIAALVAGVIGDLAVADDVTVTESRTRSGVRVALVPSDRGESPSVTAVASICGVTVVRSIDEGYFDNYGSLRVTAARPRTLGPLDSIVVETDGAGDATCHRMDGVMDFTHSGTAVLYVEGCALRVASFITHNDRCDDRPMGMRVTFDRAGNVTRAPRRGEEMPDAAGTAAITTLAR
jgi:hypothetical protein